LLINKHNKIVRMNKAISRSLSMPEPLLRDVDRYCATAKITRSMFFQSLAESHLAAQGALSLPDDAEMQSLLDGLRETCTKDELRAILSERTAAQAVGGDAR
jgi:hypothetical protein